jgi:hypothetical protein
MRKNYINQIAIALSALFMATSCSTSYLDVKPKGEYLEINYYKTPDQIYSALVAVYQVTAEETDNSFENTNWYCSKQAPLNAAADECYAGGGNSTDNLTWQVWNNYTLTAATTPSGGYWAPNYKGIYRANLLLQKIKDSIPGLDANVKARYIAETKYLRARFYFDLVRLFRNIPLLTTTISPDDAKNVTQSAQADVWAQIEKDLNDAIPVLPSTVIADENGRITKGAAMALLGKVILTQGGEGWDNSNSRMTEAANWFAQVRTSGLYSLVPNFPDIFSPDNKFNSESIYEIIHSSAQGAWWGQNPFSGNLYPTLVGPRGYGAGSGPKYVSGWSFNPIIPDFANFMSSDPRYPYTVLNVDGDANGLKTTAGASYVAGYDNTGYFVQKYAPLQQYVSLNGGQDVLNYPHDYIEIRYADVLLMEAEALLRAGGSATQAQTNLDEVRARVGFTPGSVTATLDNIYNERRLELATEGHRWFDLIRTGQAASVLAFKGFKAGKHEALPIPLQEVTGTKLKQNPGY